MSVRKSMENKAYSRWIAVGMETSGRLLGALWHVHHAVRPRQSSKVSLAFAMAPRAIYSVLAASAATYSSKRTSPAWPVIRMQSDERYLQRDIRHLSEQYPQRTVIVVSQKILHTPSRLLFGQTLDQPFHYKTLTGTCFLRDRTSISR